MNSRYSFMTEGSVADEVSKSAYPDPLSLNYLNLDLRSVPVRDKMTDSKIIYFWKEAENQYGAPCWDDIVLTVNSVSHKNFLRQGDIVYFPSSSDITTSFNKSR